VWEAQENSPTPGVRGVSCRMRRCIFLPAVLHLGRWVGEGPSMNRLHCNIYCATVRLALWAFQMMGKKYVKNNNNLLVSCLFSSHSPGIQRTHPQQTFEATPGGRSGLWQLHEQGPKRKCIWLQSLQPEQNCRHQVQHRQVG